MSSPGSVSALIEFVGLPGSGKSTIAAALMDALRARGYGVIDANVSIRSQRKWSGGLQRLACAAAFTARNPLSAGRAASLVKESGQKSVNDVRAVLTNLLCKCRTMGDAGHRGGVWVSDEGVLHAVWSVVYRSTMAEGVPTAAVRVIRDIVPKHWIVVRLDVGSDTALQRLRTRTGRQNRLARDTNGGKTAYENAAAAMRTVQTVIDEVSRLEPRSVTVINVSNQDGASAAKVAERITARLTELW